MKIKWVGCLTCWGFYVGFICGDFGSVGYAYSVLVDWVFLKSTIGLPCSWWNFVLSFSLGLFNIIHKSYLPGVKGERV